MTENHVESCYCWKCGGHAKVMAIRAVPDYIRGGHLEEVWIECDVCYGEGEKYRAKLTQTTTIRAFLTQAKHALEDINVLDSDLDQIYTKIDQVVADVEHYETKVGTRDGN